MSITGLFKRTIKRMVTKFGYELRALNILQAKDAVEYNTTRFADRFYGDPVLVKKYLHENIPVHLRNLEVLLQQHAVPIHAETSILDAGCGTGHCLKMLQDKYGCKHLSGSDFSEQALQISRKICPQANLYRMDLMKDNLPATFDLILCQQVLEHLTKPELALHHLEKMLRPDGRLIITIPDGRLDDFAGHIHFWSRDSLPLFLEKELPGYRIVTGSLQDEVCLYAIVEKVIS
jgi:2-polyprenyl-3-methyl-5-hydroxy-6-metoxy-1,4-benzoquinol methylase